MRGKKSRAFGLWAEMWRQDSWGFVACHLSIGVIDFSNSIGSFNEGQGHATFFFRVPQIWSCTVNYVVGGSRYKNVHYLYLILYWEVCSKDGWETRLVHSKPLQIKHRSRAVVGSFCDKENAHSSSYHCSLSAKENSILFITLSHIAFSPRNILTLLEIQCMTWYLGVNS